MKSNTLKNEKREEHCSSFFCFRVKSGDFCPKHLCYSECKVNCIYSKFVRKEETGMANKFQTNQQGVIKAPNPVRGDPGSTTKTGTDLRVKQGK